MRIQRFLARAGLASRREAEALIEKGLIKVNGKVVSEPFFKVNPENDLVEFNGKRIKIPVSEGCPLMPSVISSLPS